MLNVIYFFPLWVITEGATGLAKIFQTLTLRMTNRILIQNH